MILCVFCPKFCLLFLPFSEAFFCQQRQLSSSVYRKQIVLFLFYFEKLNFFVMQSEVFVHDLNIQYDGGHFMSAAGRFDIFLQK